MLGYRDHELENSFDTWQSRVHPDDLEKAVEAILKTHEKPNLPYESIHRLRHKDGHWVWILDRGQTIFDEDNKAIRMVGFHTDITKEKEVEIKLRESKHQFDLFMENIPHVITIKDENLRVVYANKLAEKYIHHKLIGNTSSQNINAESAILIDTLTLKALKEGIAEDIIEIHIQDDIVMTKVTAFSINQENGTKYVGVLYVDIAKDIEAQEKLAQEEEKSHELSEMMIAQSRHAAMGEMTSMIAHQWRQPISVIAMDANNILADIELEMIEEETLRDGAEDIIKQTQELSRTIDDFRNFFRPETGKEEVLLSNVVNDALGIIGQSLVNNDVKIETLIDEELRIDTYSRELMQVLVNIIKNAKEALLENEISNKKILIESQEEDECLVLRVSDNAGGIPQSNLDKIFDPYFTTKGEKNGTGLGLYMSKTIIDKHLHGILKAYNLEDGALFEIRLPKSIENEGVDDES